MKVYDIIDKAFNSKAISHAEALYLWKSAALPELMSAAHELRLRKADPEKVTWIIDRNINITNVCCSGCLFCNFYVSKNHEKAYITSPEEYDVKIREMMQIGGRQLLLQGGMHPGLGLQYYVDLFSELKSRYPDVKLHALGPPEIVHLSKMEDLSYSKVLIELRRAGLDTLPGAGAEMLSDRTRGMISKGKCTADEWLLVMWEAHKLNITTSATMMYGHVETIEERLQHLILIRELQSVKPTDAKGFISFTPWPFQHKNTALYKMKGISHQFYPDEYLRLIAISRLILNNIDNIQASWLTVGREVAQICLHAGANDLSSIMIEENVVSAAGATFKMGVAEMEETIREAGFKPARRNQQYILI